MEDPLAESIRVEDKAGRLVALQALATFRAVRPTVKTRLLIDPFVSGEFVASLHARVVEYVTERREFRHHLARRTADRRRICYIQDEIAHARIGITHPPHRFGPPACDQDLVAEVVKRSGKPPADSRATAGDEHAVRVHFHKRLRYAARGKWASTELMHVPGRPTCALAFIAGNAYSRAR